LHPTPTGRTTVSEPVANPAGKTTVVLRRARSDDREPLRQLLSGLSQVSRYQRFFTGAARIRERDFDVLLCDGRPGSAVVATSGPEMVGHAMWAPMTDAPGMGEVGVVVADHRRRRGIGIQLVSAVLADAQRAGIHTLEALVLPGNEGMHRLIRCLLPHLAPEPDEDLLRYRMALADYATRAA
jgi:RimJ/RimL family protein N-acetyltransferase